jgi:methylglutaconyl-CoA hydratase
MSDLRRSTAHDGTVLRIVLDRAAKRNALTRALLAELVAVLDEAQADAALRAVVVSAAGPVFCAGMDLAEMQSRAAAPDAAAEWETDTRVYCDALRALAFLRVPTVAVVQGPVLAGGVGLVAACDLVLCAEAASFALPEPKRGIVAAVVAPLLLHRTSPSAASHLLLSGATWSARDALRTGLCHAVVPDEALESTADAWLASLLTGAPGALAATKRTLLELAAPRLADDLERARELSAAARATDEAREGLAAFLEKRRPRWAPEP